MKKQIWRKKRERFVLAGICTALFLSGCGADSGVTAQSPESVELIEPVGVALNYELADYRDLYEAKTYNALVCPYVEEFAPESAMDFDGYGALPGDTVSKGQVLMKSNTEWIQEQIEEKEKEIARKEKEYQEYVQDITDDLKKPREEVELWEEAVEKHSSVEPKKDETNTDEAYLALFEAEYAAWKKDMEFYDMKYHNALINVQKKERDLRQRTGLYELDSAYDNTLLGRMKEDMNKKCLLSGRKGVVANVAVMSYGDRMEADVPMAAVIDPDRKLLRCAYVSKSAVNKAQEYYAVINGKRYELEYEVMEQEEYAKIAEKNGGKVYTTFYLKEDADEVEMGSFATVVFIMEKKESVLTVPVDAVKREKGSAYVYVLRDGKSVQTPVRTGMKDSFYVEILSGVEAGDQIMTEKAPKPAGETTVLQKGKISSSFSATGYLFYPVQKLVTVPVKHGTVYYVSTDVELNQTVKKGDPLFTIRVKADDAELARYTLRLQREQERVNDLIKQDADANKKAIAARQETIAELEKEIAEIQADFATTQICAPYDGIVTYRHLRDLKEGDLLHTDEALAVLAAGKSNYIVVEDTNGVLSYGNTVSIGYRGEDNQTISVEGTVMSLGPFSVSQALFAGGENVLIKVSEQDVSEMAVGEAVYGWWTRNRYEVKASIRETDNVLLVPKKAVLYRDDCTYVRVKDKDGTVRYQSFVAGGSDSAYYWVAEGLTEGMEVCLE